MFMSVSQRIDTTPSTARTWSERFQEDHETGQRMHAAGMPRSYCENSHQQDGWGVADEAADEDYMREVAEFLGKRLGTSDR